MIVSLVLTDMLSQLHLYSLYGDAAQQGVLLWKQPDEGPDRADAAKLWDAAGAHLHASAGPLHPAVEGVAGQLPVSSPYWQADLITVCSFYQMETEPHAHAIPVIMNCDK